MVLTTTSIALALLALSVPAASRKISIKNSCSATIFPAYTGGGGAVTLKDGSQAPTGWSLPKGQTTDLTVPDLWPAARIWARTGGCNENVANCRIGGCGGGLLCPGSGGPGATLAEFTLSVTDSYDVSMVDGFSVPMTITPSDKTCLIGSCGAETDILTQCDPNLVWPKDSTAIYSCGSACRAGVQYQQYSTGLFDPGNSASCCIGTKWGARDQCPKKNIPYYDAYKKMCKNGYVFADDDDDNGVHSCSNNPSYTIEFCPGGLGSGLDNPLSLDKMVKQDPGGTINSVADQGNTYHGAAPPNPAANHAAGSGSASSAASSSGSSNTAAVSQPAGNGGNIAANVDKSASGGANALEIGSSGPASSAPPAGAPAPAPAPSATEPAPVAPADIPAPAPPANDPAPAPPASGAPANAGVNAVVTHTYTAPTVTITHNQARHEGRRNRNRLRHAGLGHGS